MGQYTTVIQTRELILHRNSHDPKIASAGIEVCTDRKWRASQEFKVAEERQRQKALVDRVTIGKVGLGYYPSAKVDKTKGKERRQLFKEEVQAEIEEAHISKMISLSQQGTLTWWESIK